MRRSTVQIWLSAPVESKGFKDFPAKGVISKIIDESNPKVLREMVSNLSETLKKDDATISGKMEIVKKMLAKNIDEKLISEVSGLPTEQINALKKNLEKLH